MAFQSRQFMLLFKLIVKEQLKASKLEKVTCAIEQAVPTVVKLVGKENVNHEDTATAEEMKKVNFAPTVEGVNVSSLDSPQWDQSTNNQREESEEELKTREEIKIK